MRNEPFDLSSTKVAEPGWAKKYCLNRLAEFRNIESVFRHLIKNGGIGGDIEWGIHKWDENTATDFEVGEFEGYRYYVGELEHGIQGRGDIEEFSSDEELRDSLSLLAKLYVETHPGELSKVEKLAKELNIPF
jgi:hypothetical protein